MNADENVKSLAIFEHRRGYCAEELDGIARWHQKQAHRLQKVVQKRSEASRRHSAARKMFGHVSAGMHAERCAAYLREHGHDTVGDAMDAITNVKMAAGSV